MTAPTLLRASGIAKRYGGIHALKTVDFDVTAGEVTTLFGENGAGKSTLMKILAGIEQPTEGELWLDEVPIRFESSTAAVASGVVIIHQELSLCSNLSVRDNIFLGREMRTRWGSVDYRAEDLVVRELMARLNEEIQPSTPLGSLQIGQQQIVEIARALLLDARVLIMDEPTSALSATEVTVLFDVVRDLTAQGVGIVYISHHLEEAMEISDQVAVLRDGRMIDRAAASEVDLPWIVERMTGSEMELADSATSVPREHTRLAIDSVTVSDPRNASRAAVDALSLDVREGEIVCLYGVMGAGRTELLEAIAGRTPIAGGRVFVDDEDMTGAALQDRIESGIVLVPEDRQRDGLVQTMSIQSNLSLSSLPSLTSWGLLSRTRERSMVRDAIEAVGIKAPQPELPIGSLSGGNQQKVVIGKVLQTAPRVILLDEPARGIDVRAKAEVFRLLDRLAADGLTVLYATSEISEAMGVAHRTVVLRKGHISGVFQTADVTKHQLMAASGEPLIDHEEEGNNE